MKISKNLLIIILFGFVMFLGGLFMGMIFIQQQFLIGMVEVAEVLEGANFELNIDLNETLIVDRTMEHMGDWFKELNVTTQENLNES